jgi:hypothetical protein
MAAGAFPLAAGRPPAPFFLASYGGPAVALAKTGTRAPFPPVPPFLAFPPVPPFPTLPTFPPLQPLPPYLP